MKIFIIGHNLTNGGAERVSALWANGFVSEGHEVTLVLSDDAPMSYGVDSSISIRSIACNKSGIFKQFYRLRKLRRLICSENPDVVIGIVEAQTLLAYIASIGKHKRIKFIKTEHNVFERPDNAKMPLKTKFFKFYVNKIYDLITVLTQADKEYIGNRLQNVTVLPNPLAFTPVDGKLEGKFKSIIAVGRLGEWYCKGFDVLLDAWHTVKQTIENDWTLQIAGQGDSESTAFLESLAKEYGISNSVQFLGYKKNIVDYYKQASVFALTSRYEGFGMVLIEAMSQGCAVISCDYKGRQKEIVQDAGLICPTDDSKSLAEALTALITNDRLREELQRKAIERSKAYDIKNTMAYWTQIFRKIKPSAMK